jgi:hypothetical protein
MYIQLIPQASIDCAPETEISVKGEVLTYNGTDHDLSAVPEGGQGWLDDVPYFIGPVRRVDGVLHLAVTVTLGPDACLSQPTDPAHWAVKVKKGKVPIPADRLPQDPSDPVRDGYFDGYMWHEVPKGFEVRKREGCEGFDLVKIEGKT